MEEEAGGLVELGGATAEREMGGRMEQGVFAGGECDGVVRGPTLLLRALHKRHVYVPLR